MSAVLTFVVLIVLVVLVARYGADSRSGPDPTGRDAAWVGAHHRPHSPSRDATRMRSLLGRLARLWAAQVRAHEVLDARLRPWEQDAAARDAGVTPGSAPRGSWSAEPSARRLRRGTPCRGYGWMQPGCAASSGLRPAHRVGEDT